MKDGKKNPLVPPKKRIQKNGQLERKASSAQNSKERQKKELVKHRRGKGGEREIMGGPLKFEMGWGGELGGLWCFGQPPIRKNISLRRSGMIVTEEGKANAGENSAQGSFLAAQKGVHKKNHNWRGRKRKKSPIAIYEEEGRDADRRKRAEGHLFQRGAGKGKETVSTCKGGEAIKIFLQSEGGKERISKAGTQLGPSGSSRIMEEARKEHSYTIKKRGRSLLHPPPQEKRKESQREGKKKKKKRKKERETTKDDYFSQ